MDSTRRARIQSLIQQELAVMINREVKDPRIPTLTLTNVELTPDAGRATIFFTLLGATEDESPEHKTKIRECLEGLNSASGYLRRHISKVLTLRQAPELAFKEDRGLSNALRVHELLKQISTEPKTKTDSE